DAGDSRGGATSTPGTLHRAGKGPLGFDQAGVSATHVPRVLHDLTRGQRSQVKHADVDTDPTGRALRGAWAVLGFAAGGDVGFVDEDGGVPAVPTPGHGHRLDPAAAVESAGESFPGVVQADRAETRHPQPAVRVEPDGRVLHVVVQTERVPATALLLELRQSHAATGPLAAEGVHPVLPRLVCVKER